MTHRCRQTDDRVLARLSGEVTDPVWADEVEAARLAGCDGCSQRLEEAEAFSAEAFAAFSEIPLPLGGADRVLAAVAVEVAQGGGVARPETGSSEAEGLRETDDPTLAGPLAKAAGNVVQAPWASGWSAVLRIAAALLFTTSFVYLGVEGLRRAGPTPELARLAPSGEPEPEAPILASAPSGLDGGESPRSGEHLAAKGGSGRRKKGSYRSEATGELEEKRGLILAKGGQAGAEARLLAPAADLLAGKGNGARAQKMGGFVAGSADGPRSGIAEGSRFGKADGPIATKGGSALARGSSKTPNRAPDDRSQAALLGRVAPGASQTRGRPRLFRQGVDDAGAEVPGAASADGSGGARQTAAAAPFPPKQQAAPGGLLADVRRGAGEASPARDGAAQAPERLGQTLAGNRALAEPASAREAVAKARAALTTAASGQRTQTDAAKAIRSAEPAAGRIAKEKTQVATATAAAALFADGLFWREKDRDVPFVRLTTEVRGAVTDLAIDAAVVERYAAHGQARTVQAIYRIALPKGAEVRDLTIGPASAARALPPSGEAVVAVPPGAEVWVRFRYLQRFQDRGEVQLPFTQSFQAQPRSRLAARRRDAANLVVDLELSQAAQRPDLRWSSNRAPALVLNDGRAVRVSLREPWPVLHEALRLRRVRITPRPTQKPSH